MEEKKIGQMSFEELAAAIQGKLPGTDSEEEATQALLMFLFNCIQL